MMGPMGLKIFKRDCHIATPDCLLELVSCFSTSLCARRVGIVRAVCTLSPVAVGYSGTADNTLAERIALAQPPRIPSYSSLCFSDPPIKQMVRFKFCPFQICNALQYHIYNIYNVFMWVVAKMLFLNSALLSLFFWGLLQSLHVRLSKSRASTVSASSLPAPTLDACCCQAPKFKDEVKEADANGAELRCFLPPPLMRILKLMSLFLTHGDTQQYR